MRSVLSISFVLVVSTTVFTPTPVSAMECSSAVVDTDGDGWGYENNQSCTIPTGFPVCSSTAIIGNGGWGFENGRSCRVGGNTSGNSASNSSGNSYPTCTSAAINNGNGWGYENSQSCRYTSNSGNSNNGSGSAYPSCTSAAINNGNGWGYENFQSCRFDGSTGASGSTATASVASASNNSGLPECSANAEDNGNGFGFEFGASCIWGAVQPAGNDRNSLVVAPPPVTVSAIGYEGGTPICLTDASDGNGDGFGYENDRSCLVVDGRTATSQDPLLNTRWCQPWAEISYGDYVLQNNTWNSGDVYSNRWSQCIELGGSRGNYVAKWDYNWLNRDEGNDFSVKSYPQVFYGRKTGNSQSGTPEALGVPVSVHNIPEFKVRYRYSETGNAERNVAFESFFHTSCEAEEWNKHFEMMVWVNKPVIKTPGTLVAEATIDGKLWDVYTNPALSWGYVAFVERVPSTQGWLDWKAFVDWTRFQGPQYGIWQVGNTCMGAIEIGTETFWGNGTFTLHEFRVTR